MNCDTGELRRFRDSEISAEFFKNFTQVPEEHSEEAERLLAEKDSVFVNMEKASPLVDWAKAERNKPHPDGNRKHRRTMAKESRKKNR